MKVAGRRGIVSTSACLRNIINHLRRGNFNFFKLFYYEQIISFRYFIFCIFGCKKDFISSNPKNELVDSRSLNNNKFLSKDEDTQTKVTILGDIRANPYSVKSMTKAYNELYKKGVMELPTILFFKSGKVIDHITGLTPKNVMISKIEKALTTELN